MFRRTLLVSTLLLVGATPPAAGAGPRWATTRDHGNLPADGLDTFDATFTQTGARVMAGWRDLDGVTTYLVTPARAGTTIRNAELDAGPVAWGPDGIALLVSAYPPDDGAATYASRLLLSGPDGVLREDIALDPGSGFGHEVVANAHGDLAAVWSSCGSKNGCSQSPYRLRVSTRAAGGVLGAPVTIADSGSGYRGTGARMAMNARGDVVVAYKSARHVRVRVRPAGGTFGPARTAGPATSFTPMNVAITDSGRIAVAWVTQNVTRRAIGPTVIHAAMRSRGAIRFRGRVIDRGPPRKLTGESPSPDIPALQLALRPDGVATVAWDGTTGLRVVTSSRAGRFKAALPISRRTHGNVGLATSATGRTLLTWNAGAHSRIYARLRAAHGARFGSTSSIPRSGGHVLLTAAFDPHTAAPAVLWTTGSATYVASRR